MNKKDILSALIIGIICSFIFLFILRSLELPEIVIKMARFLPIILPALSVLGICLSSLAREKWPMLFQMAKSFLVGILNTFIDLGVLNLLMCLFSIAAGWGYVIFKGISFSVSIINSYFWNKFWTFEGSGESKSKASEFGKFYLVAIGGLLIHLVVAPFVVNIIGPQFGLNPKFWANIGAIAAAFVGFFWNFFGFKLLVFKK